ncbi:ATP-binding protein [Streptomyces sp. NPDC060035]|uniref:ATP-binding protein n=1 Tax=Streptomyces sp. NPDC060035 TaxID=3347044 RepID=UPI0036A3D8DA
MPERATVDLRAPARCAQPSRQRRPARPFPRHRRHHAAIRTTVSDGGPNIPPDQRQAMKERFTRGARARAPGSGLALVEQQAQLHHGTLHLGQSPGGGLGATVSAVRTVRRPRASRVTTVVSAAQRARAAVQRPTARPSSATGPPAPGPAPALDAKEILAAAQRCTWACTDPGNPYETNRSKWRGPGRDGRGPRLVVSCLVEDRGAPAHRALASADRHGHAVGDNDQPSRVRAGSLVASWGQPFLQPLAQQEYWGPSGSRRSEPWVRMKQPGTVSGPRARQDARSTIQRHPDGPSAR